MKRALYGLKQTPRAWYSTVDTYLQREGLHKSTADGNLYYLDTSALLTLLLLYIDDVYITGDNDAHIAHLRATIQGEFEMSNLGLLSYSLGVEFLFSALGIMMTQRQYIREILPEFGLGECRPVKTPMVERPFKLNPGIWEHHSQILPNTKRW